MRTKLYKCNEGHLFAGNMYVSECEGCGTEDFDHFDANYVWCGKYGRKKDIIKLDAVDYEKCPCGNGLVEKQKADEVFRCTEGH
jgi:hypothetical protein